MFVARNDHFLEKEFIFERTSGSKVYLEEVRDPQNSVEPPVESQQDGLIPFDVPQVTQGPRRSDRV